MKILVITVLFFVFKSLVINAQGSQTCAKPKTEDFDLNSISKCDTGTKKKKAYLHKKTKGKKKSLKKNEVLFSVVEKAPLFPKCKSVNIKDKKSCFTKQFKKHFAKNFYPERASDNGIAGKVFIRFTVDIHGDVKNVSVKSAKKSIRLVKEVKRAISKLPHITPGKHKKMPVNVKYSLPINFSN